MKARHKCIGMFAQMVLCFVFLKRKQDLMHWFIFHCLQLLSLLFLQVLGLCFVFFRSRVVLVESVFTWGSSPWLGVKWSGCGLCKFVFRLCVLIGCFVIVSPLCFTCLFGFIAFSRVLRFCFRFIIFSYFFIFNM